MIPHKKKTEVKIQQNMYKICKRETTNFDGRK